MAIEDNFRIIVIDDNVNIQNDFIKILTINAAVDSYQALEDKLFGENKEQKKHILPKFLIDTATQGEEGFEQIKKAQAEDKPYALAFVDIRMPPGWDGIETIQHIWQADPHMQVVICTAYSDYTWEETIDQLGMTDNLLVLKKPFDNVAVRQLACALTKKWQLLQETQQNTHMLEGQVQERTDSLQNSLSMMRATLESSADGILVVDDTGNIVDYNAKFIDMFQIPESILVTKSQKVLIEYLLNQLKDPTIMHDKLRELVENPEETSSDTDNLKDGRILEHYTQPYVVNNKTIGRVWNFRDISNRIHLEEKLEFQATHDPLTNLPNRVLLADRIKQAIAKSSRHQTMFALIFFDLDRFKLINDSLNHVVGDELLKALADRIQLTCRQEDTLARLGGDEFVLLVSDFQDEAALSDLARRLLETIEQPFSMHERSLKITASMGISAFPRDGETFDDLLRNADLAMYRAKSSGSDQFQFYTEELTKNSMKRWEDESALRAAIANNEFFICYQPQVDLVEKKIIAAEALVRWQRSPTEVVLPMDFIPLAEEMGLIVPLGEWVMRTACQQNKAWQNQGLPPIKVAVNVSTAQFKHPGFKKSITDILQETGLEAKYLEVEITENVLLNNGEVREAILWLKKAGVQIVLDDFGTGNSSLNYLRNVSIDGLKIDRSFIDHIDAKGNDEVIIKAIINMANSMNLSVLAEGVETKKQLQFLEEQNCEGIQGLYFSKPLISSAMEDYLKNPERLQDIFEENKS